MWLDDDMKRKRAPGPTGREATDECTTCDGSGLDASHGAAMFYAYSGKLTSCDDCEGTGKR